MDSLQGDLIPQKLMTRPMWASAAALVVAMTVSVSSSQTRDGELISFVDYGAAGGGLLALVLAAMAYTDGCGPLAAHQGLPRMVVLALISLIAAWRVLYGLGALA
jgi:hypothetical protein